MTYCVAPRCQTPQNPHEAKFCFYCGSKLWLDDRYRPLSFLAQGGFGRTFLAEDKLAANGGTDSPARCVVKQFCPTAVNATDKARSLFHQEADRLAQFQTQVQIPRFLAHFEQAKHLYLVQEWIDGETLDQELRREGLFSEAKIWALLGEMAVILAIVHGEEIIHRDIKPSNILRRRSAQESGQGSVGQLVLIDFGVAKVFDLEASNQTATILGSPDYMAPEQGRGRVFPASDLYSLGATCVYLLTGVAPIDCYDVQADRWGWPTKMPEPPSKELIKVIGRLLAQKLVDRLGNGAALVEVLRRRSAPTRLQQAAANAQAIQQAIALAPPIVALAPEPANELHGDPDLGFDWSQYLTQVNYEPLRRYLQAEDWQEADQLTWELLTEATYGQVRSFLACGDLRRVPCGDLEIVDLLWRKYSRGRFGFSVQVAVYQSVGEDYGRFCQAVAWQAHGGRSDRWQYSITAPEGHLPTRLAIGGNSIWKHLALMQERLRHCGTIGV
jgi:serine/threonine protein kinase